MNEHGNRGGRIALVGLDGASFRVLDPVIDQGAMPALKALRQRGAEAILRSTVPTYTPPAWVSMATGVNPGRHGIFGFLASTAQEEPQIAHSGLMDAPPIWSYLADQGLRTGVFNLPMSYPPSPIQGFMISGGLASGWTDPEMPNFASDAALGRVVLDIAEGHYPLDVVVSYENDWRSAGITDRIRRTQLLRRRVLAAVLEREEPDVVFAVFEGPDRLQHLHYQYIVECSGWYRRPEAPDVREAALGYFAELDHAIGDLVDWAGPDGHVMVVSDHGFGPWEKTLNVNLLLEEWGYLHLPGVSKLTRLPLVAGAGQRLARRLLPGRFLHAAKARVSRQITWEKTEAFASHVAEQGIHINEVGRFPKGAIDEERAGHVKHELTHRLLELTDPDDGQAVVDRVVLRDDVIAGPHTPRAADLFPFCRDQRYELSDTLAARSVLTDHRDRPWGYHHIDGVFIGAGPGLRQGRFAPGLDIVDVMPTSFHLARLPVPAGLDGSVPKGLLSEGAAAREVSVEEMNLDDERTTENPFSEEEEKMIEDSLRGLGYIE